MDFEKLSLEEQSIVLGEILNLFQCKPLTADLRLINEAKYTGKVQIGKKISICKSAKLVCQSCTGLFEHTIDLLRV